MSSKNTPTAIVSGAYWAASFIEKLSASLIARGWDNEQIHALASQHGAADLERGIDAFVEAIAGPNLAEFFQTREGLWISDAFTDRVLAPALAGGTELPAKVGKTFNLPRNMSDAEIRAQLGDGHIFENARAFLVYLAGAFTRQRGGTDGVLLNNGYANIFYVCGHNEKGDSEVFTVDAPWASGRREWYLNAYRLGDRRWDAGRRAFSATAVA